MRILAPIVLIITLVISSAANASDRLFVTQAGSIGGTIGKQNKALSGEDEPRAPARSSAPQREPAHSDALPKIIRLNDHAVVGTFSITLHNVSGRVYEGTWNHGYTTKFTVASFTKENVTFLRSDYPKLGAVTGTYTGRRAGNSASGEAIVSNGFKTTWHASW